MPLAKALAVRVGASNFRFCATNPPCKGSEERIKLGWNLQTSEPWALLAGVRASDRIEFEHWYDEADLIITGERNFDRLTRRVKRGKLTFYMFERWWKPPIGMARLLHPRFALMAYKCCRLAESPYFRFLPIGGYGASDMRRMKIFNGKMNCWAYFTPLPSSFLPPCQERRGGVQILWAGRMIHWKCVDTLVRAFSLLSRHTPGARLTLIGRGPCLENLKLLTKSLEIEGNVDFHAPMAVSQVRDKMRNAHVYVLPSNGSEGWGAVLNEAMSEGCAVVACEDAGAAKTMLRHGENGLLFRTGDWRHLGELLCNLSDSEPLRWRLAEAGKKTILNLWSPEVAAERILAVGEAILAKQTPPVYDVGPMAPA
jgi:glycosyltransferase involved in cell wall biosynthesis